MNMLNVSRIWGLFFYMIMLKLSVCSRNSNLLREKLQFVPSNVTVYYVPDLPGNSIAVCAVAADIYKNNKLKNLVLLF